MTREYHAPLDAAQHGQSLDLWEEIDVNDPDDIGRRLISYMHNSRIDDPQVSLSGKCCAMAVDMAQKVTRAANILPMPSQPFVVMCI